MRLVIAQCTVNYTGRLQAYLSKAVRLIMVKADGCVAVHSDGGAYKPLNWMNAPNRLIINNSPVKDSSVTHTSSEYRSEVSEKTFDKDSKNSDEDDKNEPHCVWRVTSENGLDVLTIEIHKILHDYTYNMGIDPGLLKDGVEAQLQELLAADPTAIAEGLTLVRREYPTAIGPVDMLCRDAKGGTAAVEVKRHGEIDGVEQLTRYLEFLNRDPMLRPVRGVFVAQSIKRQARTLALSRSIDCVEVDYDQLKNTELAQPRLF